MPNDIIVFTNPTTDRAGHVAPTAFGLQTLTLDQIAQKDVPNYRLYKLEGESDGDALTRLGVGDLDTQLPYRLTERTNFPSDSTFKGAWTDANPGDTVDVDMTVAETIWRANIKTASDAKTAILTNDYTIQTALGNSTTTIEAAIAAIDGIDQSFDLSGGTDPDSLKALWPTDLAGYEPQ